MAEPATEPTRSPSPAILELMAHDERSLPCTDDMPLPDSDEQGDPVYYTKMALRHHFRHRDDVAVSADIFMYYLPLHGGEPERDGWGRPVYPRLGPDGLVSFGVPRRNRDSYVVYREGKPPDLVLEVASRSTWRRDYGVKRAIYEALGVREYFVFDARPRERGRLTGLRLEDGSYTPIEPVPVVLGRHWRAERGAGPRRALVGGGRPLGDALARPGLRRGSAATTTKWLRCSKHVTGTLPPARPNSPIRRPRLRPCARHSMGVPSWAVEP